MPRILVLTLLLAPLALAMTSASANNNYFLPGDAYFPTELTEKDIQSLKSQPAGQRTFRYSMFDGYDMAFCGNAGYERVTFQAVDDRFAENLAAAYAKVRQRVPKTLVQRTVGGKPVLEETNGIHVLFYHASFDFPQYKLGLRYNETWVDEAIRFGHERRHLRLCCLLRNPLALELSWRDAATVKPLVQTKPVLDKKRKDGPALVISDPVKAYVISPHSLDDLFQFKRSESRRVYVVDSKGVEEIRYFDGKWGPPADDDSPF